MFHSLEFYVIVALFLDIQVDTFFAVGSPLGVFLSLRNVRIGIGMEPLTLFFEGENLCLYWKANMEPLTDDSPVYKWLLLEQQSTLCVFFACFPSVLMFFLFGSFFGLDKFTSTFELPAQ